MKQVSLERDYSLKAAAKVTNYLHPDDIYIPVNSKYKCLVKNNEFVLKEQIIASDGIKTIYSPISGQIAGVVKKRLVNDNLVSCIAIKNDYKEKLNEKKNTKTNLKQYTKDELINLLDKYQLIDLKQKLLQAENGILVVNSIEDEPYISNISMSLSHKTDDILDTLDALIYILNINCIHIFVKSDDSIGVRKLFDKKERYIKIKLHLIQDCYGYGNNDALKENFFAKKDINIIDLNECICLYNLLKKKKITTKQLITISGSGVITPKVIFTKTGASVKQIIESCIKLREDKDYKWIANGLICGKRISIDDLIVTKDLKALIYDEIVEDKEKECINCGLCNEVCPMHIDPKYIMDTIKKGKEVDNHYLEKCNNCNLCTYICPAKIILNRYLKDRRT